MNDKEFEAFHEVRFNELPPELVAICVDHIRQELPESTLQDIREQMADDPIHWCSPHHFGWGMSMRNLLRDVVADDELPSGNWDDYYVKIIEEAAHVKP